MINFLKKGIFVGLLSLVVFSGFLITKQSPKAEAQLNECQILSGTRLRPGDGNIIPYADSNRPYVYFDVKTNGLCNRLILKFFTGQSTTNPDATPVLLSSYDVKVGPSWQAPQTGLHSPTNDFSLAILLGEVGNADEDCNYLSSVVLIGLDLNCNIQTKIENRTMQTTITTNSQGQLVPITTQDSSFDQVIHSIPFLQGFSYSCDDLCNQDWSLNACNPILPYGEVCPNDDNTISIIGNLNGPNSNQDTVGSGEYSEAALAPLPGFSTSPDLPSFLQSLFTIMIVIAGILALIMIIVGAITYMTSDAFTKKSQGKSYVVNALMGLTLALGAWIILNTINPELAENLSIGIPQVTLDGDANIFPDQATPLGNGTVTGSSLPTDIGLSCPGSGGSSAVPGIIDSFVGKVTYRWGGKGGPLAAGSNYPSSPNESSPYMCQNDAGESVPCRSFCPSDSVCLDCSGFVNHIRKCSGLTYQNTGTSGMVSSSSSIAVDMNTLSSDNRSITLNGSPYTFIPGDILVWNGHVVVYYGDGRIAESEGSTSGRNKNYNVIISSITKYKSRITHLIKANP